METWVNPESDTERTAHAWGISNQVVVVHHVAHTGINLDGTTTHGTEDRLRPVIGLVAAEEGVGHLRCREGKIHPIPVPEHDELGEVDSDVVNQALRHGR